LLPRRTGKDYRVRVLFVHGMGRSVLSAWPMLRRLRQAGLATEAFGYSVACQTIAQIQSRLAARIAQAAGLGPYVLVGHSLGGVLLRAALQGLPAGTAPPQRLFLLASPVRASRFATRLKTFPPFAWLTRDAGDLLGSAQRMSAIAVPAVPTTAIVGTLGFPRWAGLFGSEVNDGIVSLSEVSADWLTDQVQVPVSHTLLPASPQVADLILARMDRASMH
jgi:pimeloyl-ACP methyl ester carboxylesterase